MYRRALARTDALWKRDWVKHPYKMVRVLVEQEDFQTTGSTNCKCIMEKLLERIHKILNQWKWQLWLFGTTPSPQMRIQTTIFALLVPIHGVASNEIWQMLHQTISMTIQFQRLLLMSFTQHLKPWVMKVCYRGVSTGATKPQMRRQMQWFGNVQPKRLTQVHLQWSWQLFWLFATSMMVQKQSHVYWKNFRLSQAVTAGMLVQSWITTDSVIQKEREAQKLKTGENTWGTGKKDAQRN